jgi:predicted enzyme related to lactoylglutathione lyase
MANALNWFEIPTSNLDRAMKFYSAIFGVELTSMETTPGYKMAIFPAEDGVGGALLQGEGYVPSTEGTLVYLNGGENLSEVLNKVEGAGGKILVPKTAIGKNGFFAFFLDTEGNKVGLHSMS